MLKKKNIMVAIITIGFIVQLISTQQAQAQVAVTDPGNTAINVARNIWITARDDVLRPMGIALADQMLSKLSTDLISWANNGFDGEPGFINNYGEFIQGIEFDTINSSFAVANSIAQEQVNTSNQAVQLDLALCESQALDQYTENIEFMTLPAATYTLEFELIQCQTEISTTQSIENYSQCVTTNTQAASDYAFNMMNGPSPEFIEEFPEYLDADDELQWVQDATIYYDFMYKQDQCAGDLITDQTAGDPATIAAQNWQTLESGNVSSSRAVAETVADFGVDRFNNTQFSQVASGGADLTLALLGSQSRKDDFRNDITAGGWDGILSLTGEGSTELGLTSTVQNLVSSDVGLEVALQESMISLPTQILSKTTCQETDPVTGECLREIVETPGDQVANQLTSSLEKDQRSGEAFGDDIVGLLISSLGQTVGKLTDQGLSALTQAAGDAFFSPSQTQNIIQGSTSGGDFQSDFNVLGIEPINSNTFVGVDIPNQGGGVFGNNVDTSFIGGPEDVNQNSPIGSGPQVIIDLKENLEDNINYVLDESFYFEKSATIIRDSKQTAIELDRCLPGPDYNWEERYNDVFDTFSDNDAAVRNRIGLLETKEMVNDPMVNIPGSTRIKNTFENIVNGNRQESAQLKQRKDDLENVLNILNFIKEEIQIQLNNAQPTAFTNNITLFKDQWDPLMWYTENELAELSTEEINQIISQGPSNEEKIVALESAAVGFTKSDGTESGGYIAIRTDQGETAASIVANEPNRARNAVITMAWDMWRDGTSNELKTELRYNYYILQNTLSNEQFIARARANFTRIDRGRVESQQLLSDCVVLKAYTFGISVDEIGDISIGNANSTSFTASSIITTGLLGLNPYLQIANLSGLFGSSTGNFSFIEPEDITPRNNDEIKEFLEEQRVLFTDGDPNTESVFSTPHMISGTALANSILGFNDSIIETVMVQTTQPTETESPEFEEQELPQSVAYFQSNYPDFDFKPIQKNRYELFDLWKYDRFNSSFSRARGQRSILYCRNPRVSDLQRSTGLSGDDASDFQPECIRNDWPIAKNLDYEVLFAEI